MTLCNIYNPTPGTRAFWNGIDTLSEDDPRYEGASAAARGQKLIVLEPGQVKQVELADHMIRSWQLSEESAKRRNMFGSVLIISTYDRPSPDMNKSAPDLPVPVKKEPVKVLETSGAPPPQPMDEDEPKGKRRKGRERLK